MTRVRWTTLRGLLGACVAVLAISAGFMTTPSAPVTPADAVGARSSTVAVTQEHQPVVVSVELRTALHPTSVDVDAWCSALPSPLQVVHLRRGAIPPAVAAATRSGQGARSPPPAA